MEIEPTFKKFAQLQEQINALHEEQLKILKVYEGVCPEIIKLVSNGQSFGLCESWLDLLIGLYLPYYPTYLLHVNITHTRCSPSNLYRIFMDGWLDYPIKAENKEDLFFSEYLKAPILDLLTHAPGDEEDTPEYICMMGVGIGGVIKITAHKCILVGLPGKNIFKDWEGTPPSHQQAEHECQRLMATFNR